MTDLFITHEGDLWAGSRNDIQLAENREAMLHAVALGVKTEAGTYPQEPAIGNELYRYIGLPMTDELLRNAESSLLESLLYMPSLLTSYVEVRAVPITRHLAIFMVSVSDWTGQEEVFKVPFDFLRGVVRVDIPDTLGVAQLEEPI